MAANALIIGPASANRTHLVVGRAKVLSLLHHGNWHIWIGDSYGVEAEVLRICLDLGRKVTVVGTSRRPSNGAPMRCYQRVVTLADTTEQKRKARDSYLLALADHVVRIGVTEAPVPQNPIGLPLPHLVLV